MEKMTDEELRLELLKIAMENLDRYQISTLIEAVEELFIYVRCGPSDSDD